VLVLECHVREWNRDSAELGFFKFLSNIYLLTPRVSFNPHTLLYASSRTPNRPPLEWSVHSDSEAHHENPLE